MQIYHLKREKKKVRWKEKHLPNSNISTQFIQITLNEECIRHNSCSTPAQECSQCKTAASGFLPLPADAFPGAHSPSWKGETFQPGHTFCVRSPLMISRGNTEPWLPPSNALTTGLFLQSGLLLLFLLLVKYFKKEKMQLGISGFQKSLMWKIPALHGQHELEQGWEVSKRLPSFAITGGSTGLPCIPCKRRLLDQTFPIPGT